MKISKLFPPLSFTFIRLMSHAFAGTVTVEVRNIETKGEMPLAIYDDADVFENSAAKR